MDWVALARLAGGWTAEIELGFLAAAPGPIVRYPRSRLLDRAFDDRDVAFLRRRKREDAFPLPGLSRRRRIVHKLWPGRALTHYLHERWVNQPHRRPRHRPRR